MKLPYYVIIIMCITAAAGYGQEWKNPSDMYSHQEASTKQIPKSTIKPFDSQFENYCAETSRMLAICKAHSQRMINTFLEIVTRNVPVDNNHSFKGKLSIDMPIVSSNILKEYANPDKDVDVNMLPNVDGIISNIKFQLRGDRIVEDQLLRFREYMYFTYWNINTFICLCCIFMLFLGYKLIKAKFRVSYVFKFFIYYGLLIDFALQWLALLQKADIESAVVLQRFVSIFGDVSDDCKAYYIALNGANISISPFVVLCNQLALVILTPASKLGEAVGAFTSGILLHLPWGLNIILLPILLVFSLVVLCIVLIFFTRTSFSFGILGLIRFNVHPPTSNMEPLQNLHERNMIEEVEPTVDTCEILDSEECSCCEKMLKSIKDEIHKAMNEEEIEELHSIRDT